MKKSRFKKGVASFYIVAFAALILVIVASSFAMVVMSEVERTSGSDLSRSAYDSAMAGVEDAKLALLNYQSCLKQGYRTGVEYSGSGEITCENIIYYMQHPDCDMVAKILGRTIESNEVKISEGAGSGNNMDQAYTCVMINTKLSDYRADLDPSSSYRIIKVALEDESQINQIKYVKISWNPTEVAGIGTFSSNFIGNGNSDNNSGRVSVWTDSNGSVPTYPTLALQLVQTAKDFKISDINSQTNGSGQTDRAMIFLVPTNLVGAASGSGDTYIGAYKGGTIGNNISAEEFAKTNNLEKNLPYVVYCNDDCVAMIGIPEPIGGNRSTDTFMFAVSLPYGQPATGFSLTLCTDISCESGISGSMAGEGDATAISLSNMQVAIDSTGRANDLYRRVEVRLEGSSSGSVYLPYVIQATDNDAGGEVKIEKELIVGSEYGL